MPPANLFHIAFGDYALSIDRDRRTYSLTETKSGTVWAEDLPLGWLEIEDRLTGGVSRYDFGQATLFSLSERAGPQGKEILFGLECQGIPLDIYVTCGEGEIKLTVEANRDSKTHRLSEIGLLPDLCAIPDDGASYLVVPNHEGAIAFPKDAPENARFLRVWQNSGLSMPFFGAVRTSDDSRSALALVTDSAYASLRFVRGEDGGASLSAHYSRDPERRRLELAVRPLAGGDYVAVAQAYRERVIGLRQHVLLRRKARERPEADVLLGGANIKFPIYMRRERNGKETRYQSFADVAAIARDLKENLEVDRAMCVFWGWGKEGYDRLHPDILPAFEGAGGDAGMRAAADEIKALGFLAGAHDNYQDIYEAAPSWDGGNMVIANTDGSLKAGGYWAGGQCWLISSEEGLKYARRNLPEIRKRYGLNAYFIDTTTAAPLYDDYSETHPQSRWDDLDRKMELIALSKEHFPVFGSETGVDWSAMACDYWEGILTDPYERDEEHWTEFGSARVPLYSVVYHDSVIGYPHQSYGLRPDRPNRFLRSLRALCPPYYFLDAPGYFDPASGIRDYVARTYAVLAPLHRLSFPAFLTAHRFLTSDFQVEEARYSNGARIVVNSGDAVYEEEDVALPPGGFLAEHPQFVAHDALRVGERTLPGRAWRIERSRDGKTLAESADIARREFPV